jgi:hypothetical protein
LNPSVAKNDDKEKFMILHFDLVLKISCLFVSKAHGNHEKASSKIKRAEICNNESVESKMSFK